MLVVVDDYQSHTSSSSPPCSNDLNNVMSLAGFLWNISEKPKEQRIL
jgi:hypothetical protein